MKLLIVNAFLVFLTTSVFADHFTLREIARYGSYCRTTSQRVIQNNPYGTAISAAAYLKYSGEGVTHSYDGGYYDKYADVFYGDVYETRRSAQDTVIRTCLNIVPSHCANECYKVACSDITNLVIPE